MNDVMAGNIIAQEEALDMQDPLRHLMHQSHGLEDADDDVETLLPPQQPSVKDQLLEMSFTPVGTNSVSILLSVDASPGCGGIAWPAGEVLAKYLVRKGPDYIKSKIILELGSGTGLVGLVAGKMGGRVWVTDLAPLLGIMEKNVALNDLEPNVTVAELNWGCPIPADIPRPVLVLAADCVYFEPAFPLLVQTLSDLADDTTEFLFCYKKRRKADKRFFGLLKKQFSWVEVDDDPDRQVYNREAITLLRLYKTGTAVDGA